MKVLTEEEIETLPNLDEICFTNKLYNVRSCSDVVNYIMILQLHITDFCNLECSHCYGMSDKTEMTEEQFKYVIDSFFCYLERHKLAGRIHITGGEPLCNRAFFSMLNYLWEKYYMRNYPFVVEILTNGTLINEDIIARFEQFKKMIYEFQISIDGMEKTHDAIRGMGTWKKSVIVSKKLLEKKYRVSWSFVLSHKNYMDAVNVLEIADNVGINRVTVSRLIPLGENTKKAKEDVLSIDLYRKIQKALYDKAGELIERARKGVGRTYLAMNRCDLWHLADPEFIKTQIRSANGLPSYMVLGCACMVGKNYIVIMPNGDMLACRRLPKVVGNVFEKKIGEIWTESEFLKQIRQRAFKMEGKCKECEFYYDPKLKNLCGGGGPCMSIAMGLSMYAPDPMCWNVQNTKEEKEII